MDDAIKDRAIRVEGMLPRVLRTLFKQDMDDPLVDFPVGQMRMLRLLAIRSWTPSNLGEELGLSVSAVTQMANRLDSTGFLSRVEDPIDRRVKHLTLTRLGQDTMAARQSRRIRRLETVLALMPEDRQIELLILLDELIEASARASEVVDNSIFMEAEVEQKLPLPPEYVVEEK